MLLLSRLVDADLSLRDLMISSTLGQRWGVLVTSNITVAQILPTQVLEGLQVLRLGNVTNRTMPAIPLLKIRSKQLNWRNLFFSPDVLVPWPKQFVSATLFHETPGESQQPRRWRNDYAHAFLTLDTRAPPKGQTPHRR